MENNGGIIKTCSFFGHRNIFKINLVRERLKNITEEFILNGFNHFLIGTHGDFDSLALSVCRELRVKYDIKITVIFTSLSKITKSKNCDTSTVDLFKDVETLFYDIEEQYYKNRITYSNHKMIDNSNAIICHVDPKRTSSGAKNAMNYAIKNNKEVINIFE